ncbi:hypothetical protein U1Q18_051880 [Sarracenia purpurea var. burkii]
MKNKELIQLKHQCMLRNHIEGIEIDRALEFVPDWKTIPKGQSEARRSIELRRQKWLHIVHNAQAYKNKMENLTSNMMEFGISKEQFCTDIAYAYFILSHNLYVAEFGANSSATILRPKVFQQVRDPVMEKSVQILLKTYPISDAEFIETPEDMVRDHGLNNERIETAMK